MTVQGFQPGRSSGVVDTTNPNATALQKIAEEIAILRTYSYTGPGGTVTLKVAKEEKPLAGPEVFLVIPATGLYLITAGARMRKIGAAGLVEMIFGVQVNAGGLNLHLDHVVESAFSIITAEMAQTYSLKAGDKLRLIGRVEQNQECIFDLGHLSYQRIS